MAPLLVYKRINQPSLSDEQERTTYLKECLQKNNPYFFQGYNLPIDNDSMHFLDQDLVPVQAS